MRGAREPAGPGGGGGRGRGRRRSRAPEPRQGLQGPRGPPSPSAVAQPGPARPRRASAQPALPRRYLPPARDEGLPVQRRRPGGGHVYPPASATTTSSNGRRPRPRPLRFPRRRRRRRRSADTQPRSLTLNTNSLLPGGEGTREGGRGNTARRTELQVQQRNGWGGSGGETRRSGPGCWGNTPTPEKKKKSQHHPRRGINK